MDSIGVQKIHDAYIYGQEDELNRLWNEECPKTLIKFYPAKYLENGVNYLLKHLQEETIWLSSPSTFNDPFDCVLNVDCHKDAYRAQRTFIKRMVRDKASEEILSSNLGKLVLKMATNEFEKVLPSLHKSVEKKIYVTCFSEPDNLYSVRMWGHYANNHSGVCVEYDYDIVKNMCPFGCIPIKYTDRYSHRFYVDGAVENTKNILNMIYKKATEWEYEKEWRVAYYLDENKGAGFNSPCGLPKRVYLGCKVGEKLKKDVLDLCKVKGIEVMQMSLLPESYKLFVGLNLV